VVSPVVVRRVVVSRVVVRRVVVRPVPGLARRHGRGGWSSDDAAWCLDAPLRRT